MTSTPVVAALSSGQKPSKLTGRQLAKLRARLVQDLERTWDLIVQLAGDIESIRVSRQDVATDDEHDPEGPTLAFERSQVNAVLDNTRTHLASIEQALALVDGDEFGICAGCGERIPFARLEVRPYATRCVSCADAANR